MSKVVTRALHRRELLDFSAERIGSDPPDEVRLFDELPRGVQGKVLKREVRDVVGARSG